MGCLAGPVVAAAVVLGLDDIPRGIDDSKRLTAKQRIQMDKEIRARARGFAIGIASVEEIDTLNILKAAHLAMARAVQALPFFPDILLIDGRFKIESCALPQRCLIKGDHLSVSIGAASIVAKVYRDAWMTEMDTIFSGYGFSQHKGYGSVLHRQHLMVKGPCSLHRKSFSWTPVEISVE